MDLEDLGRKVRDRREEMGLTRPELEAKSHVSLSRIQALENGRALDMKFASVVAILEALEMSVRIGHRPGGRPTFEEIREENDDAPGLG